MMLNGFVTRRGVRASPRRLVSNVPKPLFPLLFYLL